MLSFEFTVQYTLWTHTCTFIYVHSSFEGAGKSISATREVLSSIASDCMIEEGECLNAVEIFWCPSDPDEVMSRRDMIADFPELLDL